LEKKMDMLNRPIEFNSYPIVELEDSRRESFSFEQPPAGRSRDHEIVHLPLGKFALASALTWFGLTVLLESN
jgi:hypothetical protein